MVFSQFFDPLRKSSMTNLTTTLERGTGEGKSNINRVRDQ